MCRFSFSIANPLYGLSRCIHCLPSLSKRAVFFYNFSIYRFLYDFARTYKIFTHFKFWSLSFFTSKISTSSVPVFCSIYTNIWNRSASIPVALDASEILSYVAIRFLLLSYCSTGISWKYILFISSSVTQSFSNLHI